ncbi:MAG: ATP-binding protein [Muribaculaceae bacterium]|nr:ATP-binding protein [Muribaculaceae bacterium]
MYCQRIIDSYLKEWAERPHHKPLLLRGARQVGKSTAIRHLGESFESFVEVNFERNPEFKELFKGNLDVRRIVSQMEALSGQNIRPGETLLFLDEIQFCQEAIMSLRFFKEDLPELHVIAAGSLLEFALAELPTFGTGRIHSMFMYPMSFDEFLEANGEDALMKFRNSCNCDNPLPVPLHSKLVALLRSYMLVGGMPEVVAKWVETHDYIQCQELQDDIILGYEDDFPKYKSRVNPQLLRSTLRSAAVQCSKKFSYSEVGEYRTEEVKKALNLLILAGICVPVTKTSANGIPLGAESDGSFRKILLLDCGLMMRLLNISGGNVGELTNLILTGDDIDLVNKGPMGELIAGLEMIKYKTPNLRYELYYWTRTAKNSLAEVDYVSEHNMHILPIEVKAGTRGGMKSLWIFMREKKLKLALRYSLENFGEFSYVDSLDDDAEREVIICPLYALSQMPALLQDNRGI